MHTILCYGDSNTWGYDPDATAVSPFPIRHAPDVRWTGIAAKELGSNFRLIEEGQNGRSTVHDDPTAWASRNGRAHLPVVLESHKPIDLVVLMLGTNDLKTFLNLPPQDIANGASVLVRMIRDSDAGPNGKAPRVLLVCPAALGDFSLLPDLDARLADGRAKSLQLPKYYEAMAKMHGVSYLNAQDHITASPVDGIHFDAATHAKLGSVIAKAVGAAF
jgi:lysophospholipase L1-like esterase